MLCIIIYVIIYHHVLSEQPRDREHMDCVCWGNQAQGQLDGAGTDRFAGDGGVCFGLLCATIFFLAFICSFCSSRSFRANRPR